MERKEVIEAENMEVYPLEELMGKDVVVKRYKLGTGNFAEMGTFVQCDLTGYFYSLETKQRVEATPFEVLKKQVFQIGEGDTIPGLELALRHSRVGDVFSLYCATKYAYGLTGRGIGSGKGTLQSNKDGPSKVPPNMDIEYEVEVTDHYTDERLDAKLLEKHLHQQMKQSPDEDDDGDENYRKQVFEARIKTLQLMQHRKEAGNRWFSYEDYPRAARSYSKATQMAEAYFNPKDKDKQQQLLTSASLEQQASDHDQIPEEDQDLVEIYVSCLNNMAACKLSMGEFTAAKELCVQVLQFAPLNAKALLRAAKATLALDVSISLAVSLFSFKRRIFCYFSPSKNARLASINF